MLTSRKIPKRRITIFVLIIILCISAECVARYIGLANPVRTIVKQVRYSTSHYSSDSWNLIVVNQWSKIPKDYEVELTEIENGTSVDSRVYPYLMEMLNAAKDDGIELYVRCGYRSTEEQQAQYDEKVAAYIAEGNFIFKAQRLAQEWVAKPGTSEHQLGLALDIRAVNDSDKDEVYNWLSENGYKYGFTLRYPQGKENITGVGYEPWHYRYVGKEVALQLYEANICLEEYFEK